MTHDLIKSVIESLQAEVIKVEIFDLRDQTFYARIVLESHGDQKEVDARPSDSIALALKSKAPIFANSKLFNLRPVQGTEHKKLDPQELRERLKKINPEDFGRYSL
jgi:bifunctional DNase/RNase